MIVSDLALSDEVGSVVLHGSSSANQGQASLAPHGDLTESIACQQDLLDKFVFKYGIGHVDLIKIDVEGAEFKVFAGSTATLLRDHPFCISR